MKVLSGLMLSAMLVFGASSYACDGKKVAACSKEAKATSACCKSGAKAGKACCKGEKSSTATTKSTAPAKKTVN